MVSIRDVQEHIKQLTEHKLLNSSVQYKTYFIYKYIKRYTLKSEIPTRNTFYLNLFK